MSGSFSEVCGILFASSSEIQFCSLSLSLHLLLCLAVWQGPHTVSQESCLDPGLVLLSSPVLSQWAGGPLSVCKAAPCPLPFQEKQSLKQRSELSPASFPRQGSRIPTPGIRP